MRIAHRTLFWSIFISVVGPFIPLGLWSISDRWFYPSPLPQSYGLRAWEYIFSTAAEQILSGINFSFSLALATTVLSLIFGIPAGRALGLYDFPGKRVIILVFSLPIIVPPLSVAMGLHLWFIRLGLAETFFGVVVIHLTFCLPYTIFVLWGVFSDYDPDVELQARSLGASRLVTTFKIMLPMILPGITVAALFSFLLSWSQYLSTLIIGGGKMLTLPILLFSLVESGDRPVAGAVSLIFIFPTFLALIASAHSLGRSSIQGVR